MSAVVRPVTARISSGDIPLRRNIVTANGSATLEFAKELLQLLENDTPERIEMYYQFNKQGFCAFLC